MFLEYLTTKTFCFTDYIVGNNPGADGGGHPAHADPPARRMQEPRVKRARGKP